MRLCWFIPILIGALLGFSIPAESAITTVTYIARILPPSGSSGQAPRLNCGWHDGSCGSATSGSYLDWNETSTYTVYFRGIFSRSSSPTESNRIYGKSIRVNGGSGVCDEQRVYIIDRASLTIRGTMRLLHVSTSNSGAEFNITTSGNGVYNSRSIGSILSNDSGCGAWNGTHVHAGYTTTGSASRSKNTSRFPSGDYCTNNCNSYTNTSSSNWTHKFTWSGN